MAYSIVAMKCPSCGADINVPDERRFCFCTYCGTRIVVDDGSYTVTQRTIDDAKIAEVEASSKISLGNLQMRQTHNKLMLLVLIGSVIATILFGILWGITRNEEFSLMAMMFFALSFMVIAIFFAMDMNGNQVIAPNQAHFPSYTQQLTKPYLDDYVAQLRSAGFTNIQAIGMKDVNILTQAFLKEGRIEEVQVNGSNRIRPNQVFSKDANILIRYHSR